MAAATFPDLTAQPTSQVSDGLTGTGMLATTATAPAAPTPAPAPANPNAGMLSDWYSNYLTSKPNATTWTPTKDATVAGQVDNITASNSPLMQRAETKALQTMNGRGLLNSSLAVGAGQAAVIDAALPIAQQDAGTFARSQSENAGAENQMLQQQRQAGVTGAQQQAGFTQQTALQDKDFAHQDTAQAATFAHDATMQANDFANRTALQNTQFSHETAMQQYSLAVQQAMNGADNATRTQLAQLDATTRTGLAQMEQQWRTTLQTSQSAAATFQSMTDAVTRIMLDPNLDATAKQKAIENTRQLYNNALQLQSQVTGLNLGTLIGPGTFQPVSSAPAAPAPAPGTPAATGTETPNEGGGSE